MWFSESRRSRAAVIAALVVLAVLPYLNTLRNGFVYDDMSQVLTNPYIRNLHHLREIFTTTVWSYRGGAEAAMAYYRPLMLLLYLVCFKLFGPLAPAFHLVSILLNAAVVIALFIVTERLFESRALAFAAAAIFALHPIHTEAVAWIAAVTDLELSLFYLVTFWVFLGLPQRTFRRALLAELGMSAAFALTLLSKESAVTLPLVATVYEHFYREDRLRTRWAQKMFRYGILWVLNIIYLVFRFHFLGGFKAVRSIALDEASISALVLVGQYLWKFLWPVRLCAFYVFPEDMYAQLTRAPGGLVAAVLVLLLFWILWRSARRVSFGLVWFVATIAPVLNAQWMPASVFSERYLYLPSAGLCWVLAWGCTRLFDLTANRRAIWRWGLATVLAVIGSLAVFRIVTRNRDWHDEITFYTSTLAVSPNSVQMLNNLGEVYYNRGDYKAAQREWLRAQKIAPDYPILLDNLGLLLTQERRYNEAVAALEHSVRLAPNDAVARVNLGEAYYDMGKVGLADQELRAAVELAPLNVRARISLGEFYFDQGKYAEAAEQFKRSIESVPTPKAYLGEGLAYFQMGKREQAEGDLRQAEALDPGDSRPHFVRGFFYGETGRKEQAIEEYERGFKIDPNNPEARAAFQKLTAQSPATAKP